AVQKAFSLTDSSFTLALRSNWLQYGENCYFFSEEWKTWQESKAKCSALESRLIKIESKENSSIFWIGLSHNRAEGPWLWEDGSAFSPDLSVESPVPGYTFNSRGESWPRICKRRNVILSLSSVRVLGL
uniref:Natural killer cells antigen CD94 n=1 Tax=Melopsittacus undulatus TaxID=13146 RepID=A0A8C6JYG5_MELUD